MLFANDGHAPRATVAADTHPLAEVTDAIWLDLLDATDAERSLVEHATGLRVPALAELEEIETSSRLNLDHGTLYLSTTMSYLDSDGMPQTRPLGLVLSDRYLLTIRYAQAPVIDQYAVHFAGHDQPCSTAAFVGLLDAIGDRLADVLERIRSELDAISHRVFRPETKMLASKTDAQLRATLRNIGRAGDRLSNLRDSLLGLQRITGFATEHTSGFMPKELLPRLVTLRQDLQSLVEYNHQMTEKTQFLLDATLGFINIEQNNSIKILTVVSVVGVPPTLVASIYGMNFKWIPELQWEYGYFYGLCVILASAILPLLWFKRKGWI